MTSRTTAKSVHFARPFKLRAMMDEIIPAGAYTVETDEELIDYLSFPAYRRTAMWMRIPRNHGGANSVHMVQIEPYELGEPENGLPGPLTHRLI